MKNEIVRVEMDEPVPAPVGTRNRVMAWSLVAVGSLGIASSVWDIAVAVLAGRWSEAESTLGMLGIMAMGCALFGRALLRAALTGVDPDSADRAKAEVEHRALLAALRATGEEHPARNVAAKPTEER